MFGALEDVDDLRAIRFELERPTLDFDLVAAPVAEHARRPLVKPHAIIIA
jgi:hypothetical protein